MIRFFDFLFALLGLVIFLPLIILIFLIGLIENGSPLFIQKRIGYKQKLFTLIKTEEVILAFSPGGVNEMGLLAAFLEIEPAYVLTHHLFRLCTVLILLIFAKKYLYPKFKIMKKIS